MCLSRNNTARPLSNTEDHVNIADKFNRYFTSLGRLTAVKANYLIQELQLDVNVGDIQHEPTEPSSFSFKAIIERDVESVVKGLSTNTEPGYNCYECVTSYCVTNVHAHQLRGRGPIIV